MHADSATVAKTADGQTISCHISSMHGACCLVLSCLAWQIFTQPINAGMPNVQMAQLGSGMHKVVVCFEGSDGCSRPEKAQSGLVALQSQLQYSWQAGPET